MEIYCVVLDDGNFKCQYTKAYSDYVTNDLPLLIEWFNRYFNK